MSQLQNPVDLERLLQLLLHDVRSPLGVAQGYVSLLSGLTLAADDRVRALNSVTDAISRISRLVDDVTQLMADEPPESLKGFVPASLLCERVAVEAGRRGMHVASRDACDLGKVRVGTSVDRISEAITIILTPSERLRRTAAGPLNLAISNSGDELGFRVAEVGSAHPRDPEFVTFDQAAIGSVEYLKAYRHISLLDGRVWRQAGESRACAVTLPLSA
jgi:hypothetical protein